MREICLFYKIRNYSVIELEILQTSRNIRGAGKRLPRGAVPLPGSRRREKYPWEPTGEVRPAFAPRARGQSGARSAPPRNARGRAQAPAQVRRESGSGSAARAGRRRGEGNEEERNGMKERYAGCRRTQLQRGEFAATTRSPPPLAGWRIQASPPGGAHRMPPTACPRESGGRPGPRLRAGKPGPGLGSRGGIGSQGWVPAFAGTTKWRQRPTRQGRQAYRIQAGTRCVHAVALAGEALPRKRRGDRQRPHAEKDHRICIVHMQIMTSHDIP